jgi:RNA polymerase sigma factor (sigma-70 family)
MVVSILEMLAKKHNDWVRIVQSFGVDKITSEDYVQDMYLKIHEYSEKNDNSILYNKTEVNYYFVYKVLRSIWLNSLKDKNRYVEHDLKNFEKSSEDITDHKEIKDLMEKKLSQLYWYDRKIFEMVYKDGISMLQISDKTGIDYCSIKRTIKKVKKILQ